MYCSKIYSKMRSTTIFGLILLSLSLILIISVSGVVQAAGTATGLVFRDYNANGVQDANESAVGGVTINAYGAAGTVVATTTSSTVAATLGQYTITWASADTRVRLEFTGLPGVAQQGAFGGGGGSGTSVQFVDAGAMGANYGINRPSDYCLATNNLQLVTTCFEFGAQTSTTAPVVVSHPYTAPAADTPLAFANQVGTTWGVAYKRGVGATPGITYVSAFAKRQAGYGPGGSGAIYAIQGATVTTLATLNAGATAHNAVNFAVDSTFFDVPGKQGLGDMDISEDGTTLYVVNLFDRQLYSVNTVGGAVTPRGVIGNPACAAGVYRPFGLGIRDGLVYVGGVCTNENAALGTTAGLQAYVFSFNPTTNVTTQVLTFPLNYPRGCTDIDPGYGNPGAPIPCRTTANGSQADWQPWHNTWPTPNLTPPGSGFVNIPGTGPTDGDFFAYPQPILSGVEFVGEDMVVSFRDRTGDQIGYLDNGPDDLGGVFPDRLITITAGDLLRAAPNGAGGWTLENNAQGADFGPSAGNGNEQGPGNGEFFFGDNFAANHDETITGGITVVPGSGEVAAEAMDPAGLFSAGTAWFNNGTGARNRSFTIIPATAPFGKGNGLGDLAALCDSAPVEIGNYVWFDTNRNGIQDPNETPLAGIILTLVDGAGNPVIDPATGLVATATTDANGQYIFSNGAGANSASFRYGLPIAEGASYQVRIDTTQPNLATFTVTLTTAGGGANAVRDSNGVLNTVTNIDSTTVTIGSAGQNNHTLDFGFFVGTPLATPTPTLPAGTPGTPPPPDVDISKQVDPAFAMPGDQVRWTITLHNSQAFNVNNVSFVDNFSSQLDVLSATVDTQGGSLVVTGNTVSYNIVVMTPGQTIKVSVLTRIKANTPLPFIINNLVVCTCGTASASVLSVGSLPATGFGPPWREPLLVGVAVLLVLFGVGALRARQRRYGSSP